MVRVVVSEKFEIEVMDGVCGRSENRVVCCALMPERELLV